MGQQTENGSPQTGPHLDDKLHISIDGEAGGNEGGVQRPAEGGQRVHGLPVVEAEDGVNSSGELGADWRQGHREQVEVRDKHRDFIISCSSRQQRGKQTAHAGLSNKVKVQISSHTDSLNRWFH